VRNGGGLAACAPAAVAAADSGGGGGAPNGGGGGAERAVPDARELRLRPAHVRVKRAGGSGRSARTVAWVAANGRAPGVIGGGSVAAAAGCAARLHGRAGDHDGGRGRATPGPATPEPGAIDDASAGGGGNRDRDGHTSRRQPRSGSAAARHSGDDAKTLARPTAARPAHASGGRSTSARSNRSAPVRSFPRRPADTAASRRAWDAEMSETGVSVRPHPGAGFLLGLRLAQLCAFILAGLGAARRTTPREALRACPRGRDLAVAAGSCCRAPARR